MHWQNVIKALLWSCLAGRVLANATPVDRPLYELSLEQLLEVKVTSSATADERFLESTGAVTVFTRADLARLQLRHLEDLVDYVPGMQSTRHLRNSLTEGINTRGRRSGPYSPELLILVDGERSSAFNSPGGLVQLPLFPLRFAERVEFIRGAGSSIHGSNADGGVINIVTRRDAREATVELGSFEGRAASISYAQASHSVAAWLQARYYEDDGEHYTAYDGFSQTRQPTRDPRILKDLYGGARWQNWELRFGHSVRQAQDFYVYGEFADGVGRISNDHLFGNLRTEFDLGSNLRLALNAHAGDADRNEYAQLGAAGELASVSTPSSDAPLLAVGVSDAREARLQAEASYQSSPRWRLFAAIGQERTWREFHSLSNYDLAQLAARDFPVNYYGDVTHREVVSPARTSWNSYGFTELELHPSTDWRLLTGLRVDRLGEATTAFSPRISISRNLNEHDRLRVLYARAFHAPNDAQANTVNNPVLIGNPDLEPESVDWFEIGWSHRSARSYHTVCWYFGEVRDEISLVINDSPPPGTTYDNGGREPLQGVEWESSREFGRRWMLRASAAHQWQLPQDPQIAPVFSASLAATHSWDLAELSASAIYHGPSEFKAGDPVENRELDAFVVTRLAFHYALREDLELGLIVDNALDERIYTFTENSSILDGAPNRGRQFSVTLRHRL